MTHTDELILSILLMDETEDGLTIDEIIDCADNCITLVQANRSIRFLTKANLVKSEWVCAKVSGARLSVFYHTITEKGMLGLTGDTCQK